MVLGQELTALFCKSTETGLVLEFPYMHVIYLQKISAAKLGQLSSVPAEGRLGYTWQFEAYLGTNHSTLCPSYICQASDLTGISH